MSREVVGKLEPETCDSSPAVASVRTPIFREPLLVGRPNIGNRERYLELLGGMFDRRWLSNNGVLVQSFEARLAAYVGVKHCVVTCNGTIALEIALRALGLSGEVILPSFTFVATAHVLHWLGLTPVFVDIDPTTHCLEANAVRRALSPRTSAIMGVHLWGRGAAVAELEQIANERGIKLIFDAAHAFGCSTQGRMIGNFGDCEVFSFHATKFLNSLEGGAVATNDDALADTVRAMRNFGLDGIDHVAHAGTNGKMVEACAAMGLVNMESVDAFIACNCRNYHGYQTQLAGIPGVRVFEFDERERNNYQYIVVEIGPELGASRDQVLAALQAENVFARKYFWPGCHRMKPYCELFPWADALLPNTNAVAERVLSLPTGTSVSVRDVEAICAVIRAQAN